MSNKPTIIVITGPTASGKTQLAMNISDNCHNGLGVELINMDSAQVYYDMNIGTAKITEQEQKDYPHHLMSFLSPESSYSVAEFIKDVNKIVPKIIAKGKTPVLVGGTMMYLNALINGIAEMPDADKELREQLKQQIIEKGHQSLINELKQIDPITAARIQCNDTQRLIRFVEIARLTKTAPSKLFAEQQHQSAFDIYHIAILPDRKILHKRIESRFKQMLDNGFIEEVEYLQKNYQLNIDYPSMRCVGYKQVWQYLANEINKDELLELGVIATRQLAKRQYTWLRKIKNNVQIEHPNEFDYEHLMSLSK